MINEQSANNIAFNSHKMYESADALVEVVEYAAITHTPPASYIQIQSMAGSRTAHYGALMTKMFIAIAIFLIVLMLLSAMHIIC